MKIPQTIIVQAALTGAAPKNVSPHLPVSIEDNIKAGIESWRAGASVLHIHARDTAGVPTQDYEWFEPVVDGLRKAGCEAISICLPVLPEAGQAAGTVMSVCG